MKDTYRWNYLIKVQTKDGTFEYEKEDLTDMDILIEKHPDYQEIEAKKKVKKIERRNPNNRNSRETC